MTKSCPSAAAFGVAALRPPCCATHFSALAAVRLYTVTSWPPLWPPLFLRCPAMGYPMTPRPRKATFAIPSSLSLFRLDVGLPDHLAPLVGFIGDKLPERGRCH